jgi:ABC-type branched-subunit amino acid transport system substrate-binding protein
LVKTIGAKKLAVVLENTSALDPGVNAFKAEAAKLGAEVVYSKKVQGDQTDFSGVALDLAQSGATATWLYMAPTTAAKLAVQADSAGYHPTWFANSISWNFNLALKAGGKAFLGARAFSPWPPLADPRTATYKQAYQSQNGGEAPDDLGIVGWGIGEVVGGSLVAVKGQLGQNSYREALQTLQLKPQLFNPLSFGPGIRQGGNQVAVYKAEAQGADLVWVLERDFTGSI